MMKSNTKFNEFTEEQIIGEMIKPDKLLILGKSGSGKSKQINRIIRCLENQPDTIYLFFTHSLLNHTGDASYGHINAERLHIDNLLFQMNDFKGNLNNTVIEFPYWDISQEDPLHAALIAFTHRFYDLCHKNKKRLIFITDEVNPYVNTIAYAMSNDDKCIITEINFNLLEKELNEIEPGGKKAINRFRQLYLA